MIGLILMFLMLTQYNTWILMGVMEEKSSRVVEVLLAAVRPIQLLSGKVLGIGLVAFGQAALIVAFALVLGAAVGSDLLHGTAPLVVASTLVWLVLGYAFYCWVYAAAGSMAERQDQVQSLALPLSLPIVFGYIIAITAASSGDASPLVKVLGIPAADGALRHARARRALGRHLVAVHGVCGHHRRLHRRGGPSGHVGVPTGNPAHRPPGAAQRGARPGSLTATARGAVDQTAAPAQSDPAWTVSVSCPERSTRPGTAPMKAPSRTISVPFTRTWPMPSASA